MFRFKRLWLDGSGIGLTQFSQCGVCLSACWDSAHRDPSAHGANIDCSFGKMHGVPSPVLRDMTKHAH